MNRHEKLPNVVPLLPLRNGVLFPGTVITVPVGRARSVAIIEDVGAGAIIGIAVQRDARVVDPELADLQPVGTYARVRQIQRPFNAIQPGQAHPFALNHFTNHRRLFS